MLRVRLATEVKNRGAYLKSEHRTLVRGYESLFYTTRRRDRTTHHTDEKEHRKLQIKKEFKYFKKPNARSIMYKRPKNTVGILLI